MKKYITVALAKGRLAEKAIELFEKIGFDCSQMKEQTRKLIFIDKANMFKFVLVKAADVPVYVEYGAADIGIVGRDTILEEGRNIYEVLDLKFGACRMAICGNKNMEPSIDESFNLKVATKYPNIARNYFNTQKGKNVDIIPLSGSVELSPLLKLSDVIVDIVESGNTLRENGLDILEEICNLSAWLVINKVSMKLESRRIMRVIDGFKNILAEGKSE